MYPSKSMMDYMSELNRLFPKNEENDIYQQANTRSFSLFSQSAINNSSSTDSTSPESSGDSSFRHFLQDHESLTFPQLNPEFTPFSHLETPITISPDQYESPITSMLYQSPVLTQRWRDDFPTHRRQRPIIGRRLMTNEQTSTPKPFDIDQSIWRNETSIPITANQPTNYPHNTPYELFPTENRGFDFRTVHNSVPSLSPTSSIGSKSNISPISSMSHSAPSYFTKNSTPFKVPTLGNDKLCTFCRKNGETPSVYLTHYVKEKVGNRQIVSCPILRSHVCSTCGVSGDNAHTITYCPVLRSGNNGQPLQSTTITLKNTRIQSNGKRRY